MLEAAQRLVLCLAFSVAIVLSLKIDGGKVLIIQNKGGGHGTIGYYLCKELMANNPSLEIAMIQDKCNYSKAPFSSYKDLESLGVKILDMNLGDEKPEFLDPEYAQQLSNFKADYIIDNWSKSTTNASFVLDIANKHSPKQVLFISSAGMYESSNVLPLIESNAVKTNAARKIELAYSECGHPYTSLRPQYIYGEKSNKRYLDYFIGRATRKLHTPLPLSAEQLVCLTHVEDVAALIACAIGNEAAMNEIFNCGTDRYISYKALSQLVHSEVGSAEEDAKYMYFDPLLYSTVQFPFRRESFITSPSKAKRLLGWKPKHQLQQDMKQEVSDYKQSAASEKQWVLDDLRGDMEILASKDVNFMFTYPFFDHPSINPETRPYHFESA